MVNKKTYQGSDHESLARWDTISAGDLGQGTLDTPGVLTKLSGLGRIHLVFSNQNFIVGGIKYLMKQIFDTGLTESEHFVLTISTQLSKNFWYGTKMTFGLKPSQECKRSITVVASLTGLATKSLSGLLIFLERIMSGLILGH